MFIKHNDDGLIWWQSTIVGESIPDDFKEGIIEVDFPEPEIILGKYSKAFYDEADHKVIYKYYDRELTLDERLDLLETNYNAKIEALVKADEDKSDLLQEIIMQVYK